MKRRSFVQMVGAVAAMRWLQAAVALASKSGHVPKRRLGRTGEQVSMIGLGGSHIGKQDDEKESIRIIHKAIDGGITFMDNCWDYNDGQSEIRMGKALRDGYRDRVFLMTKVDGRNAAAASKQIDESLRRLQTDHVDLLQVHEVIRTEDPDRVFADDGAINALKAAKKAGKTRFIGFTGHKSPTIHRKMLDTAARHDFRFDTVQMPLNVMDGNMDGFEKEVLPILVEREIGVLGMKPMGSGEILKSGAVSAIECLRYALSLPTSVVITGCDSLQVLDQALAVARSFEALKKDERVAVLAKAHDAAYSHKYELYKTTEHFDGTAQNPEWLG
jgi:aryl-alcohol dehydrogenase-like predicted oxidoreductase